MALVDNTTFYGKDLDGFYSAALLTGDTKSMIKLIPNVKSKAKLARLDLTNLLQADSCSFVDGGSSTLSQKTLEVCPLKVNLEFCEKDFEVNYLSQQMRPGSDADIPGSFLDYLMAQVALNISKETESLLWQGDTAGSPATLCDGFLKKFAADNTVIPVSGTTLTASNIFAEIAKVYAAIPATIINRPDLVIFIPVSAMKFYKQAIAAINPLGGTYNAGNYELNYLNIPLVVAPGLPNNKMVACETSNLWFGTDLMDDESSLAIINMRQTTGAPTIRLVTEFKFGVQYGVGAEIVFYS